MKAHDGYTGPTVYGYADPYDDDVWCFADSSESAYAFAEDPMGLPVSYACGFVGFRGKWDVEWRRRGAGGVAYSQGTVRGNTEAEAVRLVAAGGPRVR
jgi:hypothetical protein